MDKPLFVPYKAVGYVTDGRPFVVNRLGDEDFLMTTIGKSFQVYKVKKLFVCLVSREAEGPITAIQAQGQETFAVVNNKIIIYKRTRIVNQLTAHKAPIIGIQLIGPVLISYDQSNKINIFDAKKKILLHSMQSLQKSPISLIVHPASYINKIVIGYENGEFELWNFVTQKIIYTFKSHITYLKKQLQGHSAILPRLTSCEQSPATDVLALGFSSGDILMMNLKLDHVLFAFKQESSVTSLSFRTDAGAEKCPYLASGGSEGKVMIWNLGTARPSSATSLYHDQEEEDHDGSSSSSLDSPQSQSLDRGLVCSMDEAHSDAVGRVHFMHGEPVLITSSADNSLKVWVFDSADGQPRLLRGRDGHSGNPLKIRFYGGVTNVSMRDNTVDASSCEMISVGPEGAVRIFNTALETHNRELSQKAILKKLGGFQRRQVRLPQCIGFDACESRQRDWGDLVTIHQDHSNTYVWKFKQNTITEMILKQPDWRATGMKLENMERKYHSTAVALSPCGNYCAVGTRSGMIYLYNMQSGQARGSFPPPSLAHRGHVSAVNEKKLEKKKKQPGNVYHEEKKILEENGIFTPDLSALSSSSSSTSGVGHRHEVTGLFFDLSNSILVSSDMSGLLIFWSFPDHKPIEQVLLTDTTEQTLLSPSLSLSSTKGLQAASSSSSSVSSSSSLTGGVPITMMLGHKDSNFVALVCQDSAHSIRLFEISTRRLIRRFRQGHSREITDLAFTPEGRRLLSSSLDRTLRVWDLPTGKCISWLEFDTPVLSLALSHSGDSLTVSQSQKEGIQMYVDRSLFEPVSFHKEPTKPTKIGKSRVKIDKPMDVAEEDRENRDDESDLEEEKENGKLKSLENDDETCEEEENQTLQREEEAFALLSQQRGKNCITFSSLPRAYWTTLFHFDVIKARSKPKDMVQKPIKAPFFLPTLVRDGSSAPAFPTPLELEKLVDQVQEKKDKEKEKKKTHGKGEGEGEEENVVSELAGMGSVWEDEEGEEEEVGEEEADGKETEENGWGEEDDDEEEEGEEEEEGKEIGFELDFGKSSSSSLNQKNQKKTNKSRPSSSKILSSQSLTSQKRARCQLVSHLFEEFPFILSTLPSSLLPLKFKQFKSIKETKEEEGGEDEEDNNDEKKENEEEETDNETEEEVEGKENKDEHSNPLARSLSSLEKKKLFFSLSTLRSSLLSSFDENFIFSSESEEEGKEEEGRDPSPVLKYLQSLPPSAIDVQFRFLCSQLSDEEGWVYLMGMIRWFVKQLTCGRDYNVVQAYLHRFLSIYDELFLESVQVAKEKVRDWVEEKKKYETSIKGIENNNEKEGREEVREEEEKEEESTFSSRKRRLQSQKQQQSKQKKQNQSSEKNQPQKQLSLLNSSLLLTAQRSRLLSLLLHRELIFLTKAQQAQGGRYRSLLQKNMCLLRLFAGLSSLG